MTRFISTDNINFKINHKDYLSLSSAPRFLIIFVLCIFLLIGCVSSEEQQSREVANRFWQAVLVDDMESAKQLVTWESAQYLKFLRSQQVNAKRFETGELLITDGIAEVATVLYGGEKGEMEVPLRTVLIRYEKGWLVDVQKTMGSMVSGTMGTIVDQLNNFMQDGLKGLDESLSDSIDELGRSLEKGLDDLKKDLQQRQPDKSQRPI